MLTIGMRINQNLVIRNNGPAVVQQRRLDVRAVAADLDCNIDVAEVGPRGPENYHHMY